MNVIHGAWIPKNTQDFIQSGDFYLWVESDDVRNKLKNVVHPQHLPEQPLPKSIEPSQTATIPAMLIKKGGDFPAFWQKQTSFIEVMEDCYVRMRKVTLKGL
jgi:hypothetical protein